MNFPQTEKQNLWDTFLSQSTRTGFHDSHVLLLGPRNAGKRSLINTVYQNIKGSTHSNTPIFSKAEASALEYAYIPIKDPQDPENDEDVCKMNIWILDEPKMQTLLSSCIKEDTIEHMIICICLDLTQPWEAIKTLNEWMDIVNERLATVLSNLPLDKQDKMRAKLANYIKTYEVPQFDDDKKLIQPKHEERNDTQRDLPLSEDFKVNLGVPLMIIGTKSDSLEILERSKNGDYKLDFLQYALRTYGLSYAATLLYLSTKQNINLDIFYDYLQHRLFGLGLKYCAEIVHKDIVFIPSGYDNTTVITQTLPNIRSGDIFEEVLCNPIQKNLKNAEVITEDMQSFLQNLKTKVNKNEAPVEGAQLTKAQKLLNMLQAQKKPGDIVEEASGNIIQENLKNAEDITEDTEENRKSKVNDESPAEGAQLTKAQKLFNMIQAQKK